jgi:2-desacetyl-2-hydroxyethyl bacteriochlorophyllide A dehydrogenase
MKYISLEQPQVLSLKEKEPPRLSAGNVLLKIKAVGICGTDLHAFAGNQPFFSYPRILGHELAAEILESGDSHLKKGDRVVTIPYVNCEQCEACKAGKSNCCRQLKVIGVHTDGGMQEIISLPARLLIEANDMSLHEIAIVEPLSIGAHALRRSQIKEGDVMVVIGCGPIGAGLIQLGKYIGATVIAIDINAYRLNLAKDKFGADAIVDAREAPLESLSAFTGGQLAQYVFDATGNRRSMESCVGYIGHGGTIVFVGLTNTELSFHHPSLHAKEATLLCSRNATREDFQFVMKVLREKRFNLGSYITHEASFSDIVGGFNAWSSPDSKDIKIIAQWDGG